MSKAIFILLASFVSIGYWATPEETTHIVEKIVKVQAPEDTLDVLLDEIPPRYNIPREIIEVLIAQEDAKGQGKTAVRFEESPDWLARAKKITKDPEQIEMYRRSYGPLQVAGWHAARFQLTWVDLTNLRTNVEVACSVYRDAWDRERTTTRDPLVALRLAFRDYNGSGPRAEKYADRAIGILQSRLTTRWLDTIRR